MSTVEEKRGRRSGPAFMIVVSLAIIAISSMIASSLQTNFGKVRLIEVQIPTSAQQFVNGYLFVPREASAENKLPIVISMHGGLNSKEMQDAPSIELPRRGIVVLAIDGYDHGLSSAEISNEGYDPDVPSSNNGSKGMIPVVEFVYNNLEYVDTSRISVMGHSMGAGASWATVNHYGKMYKEVLDEAMARDGRITPEAQRLANSKQKIFAALMCGRANRSAGFFEYSYHSNIGFVYGSYEESGYRNRSGSPYLAPDSIELQELVNTHLPQNQHVAQVNHDTWYGNINDRTGRIIYQPPATHPWIHFSSTATKNIIDFFVDIYGLEPELSSSDQRWNLKEFFNLLAMVGLFLFIMPMAKALLSTELFKGLKKPVPAARPPLTTPLQKGLFWGGILSGVVVSLVAVLIANRVYPHLAGTGYLFTERGTSYIMVWGLISALWAVIWFTFLYRKYFKPEGATFESIGVKTNSAYILKAILFSVVLIGIIYSIVSFTRWLWRTDFRIWCIAVKTFNPRRFCAIINYLPFYLPYYVLSGVLINSALRVQGMSDGKNKFFSAMSQALGPIVVCILQYGTLLITRTPIWGADWIPLITMLFGIPFIIVAVYFSRKLFMQTGTIWVGAIFCTILFLMIQAINTEDMTIPWMAFLY